MVRVNWRTTSRAWKRRSAPGQPDTQAPGEVAEAVARQDGADLLQPSQVARCAGERREHGGASFDRDQSRAPARA
jgi:hypothetical protein